MGLPFAGANVKLTLPLVDFVFAAQLRALVCVCLCVCGGVCDWLGPALDYSVNPSELAAGSSNVSINDGVTSFSFTFKCRHFNCPTASVTRVTLCVCVNVYVFELFA